MSETKTTTRTVRQNAKCKCGFFGTRLCTVKTTVNYPVTGIGKPRVHAVRTLEDGSRENAVKCVCGRQLWYRDVAGVHRPEIECGAKCLSSKGHVCECSCGGKNHGAGAR